MPRGEMAGWKILQCVQRVLQSHEEISIHRPVHMNVVQVANPTGAGRRRKHENSHRLSIEQGQRRLIPTCDGEWDNLCLGKAIVLGMFYQRDRPRYIDVKNDRFELKRLARLLLHRAGVTHGGACGLDDVKLVQSVINARLIVYDKQRLNAVIHNGPKHGTVIHLCLFEEHYTLIQSIKAYMNTSYYCVECQV